MTRLFVAFFIFLSFIHSWAAEKAELAKINPGVKLYGGGRYDDMRMCVGSDRGVKGGPIGDIMFLLRYNLPNNNSLVFNLPVMRPILFGTAFDMLQFEPEVSLNFGYKLTDKTVFLIGPSLGFSLHYGPDYNSDDHNRVEDFFAAGPHFSLGLGFDHHISESYDFVYGMRLFHTSLISEHGDYGLVFGAAFEAGIYLKL